MVFITVFGLIVSNLLKKQLFNPNWTNIGYVGFGLGGGGVLSVSPNPK